MMIGSAKTTNGYPSGTHFETQSEANFDSSYPVRSLSPEDVQKLKYKIELGKTKRLWLS